MIALEVINEDDQHFIVRGDEPYRIEASVVDGKMIMHAYRGLETDMEQEPDLVYDGTNEENHDKEVRDELGA